MPPIYSRLYQAGRAHTAMAMAPKKAPTPSMLASSPVATVSSCSTCCAITGIMLVKAQPKTLNTTVMVRMPTRRGSCRTARTPSAMRPRKDTAEATRALR